MQFPLFKTKIKGLDRKFDLNNPKERAEYFDYKASEEIRLLREYFNSGNTFIAYLLGKKNSGKGTYSKMFAEAVDPSKIDHFSIGDMIRTLDEELQDEKKKAELMDYLKKNYRGWTQVEDLMASLEKRSTKTLLPTELILILAKREIARREKKTLFIDGFPRDLDQINLALFLRDLIGYRDDPDLFVLIDVPEKIIDERIKYRRICPKCQTSRSIKLLPTSKIDYDVKSKEFSLLCDNPLCQGNPKMVEKEGDEQGIAPIKDRLEKDQKMMEMAYSLYGVPKVLLRNSVPQKNASEYVDDYELTPEYYYEWDEKDQKTIVKERPWVINDGVEDPYFSLMPPPVVVSLIKQTVKALGLQNQ